MVGKSVRDIINDFLKNITTDPADPRFGYVDIEYTHARRTAALVATGWISGGREYSKGTDPFRLTRKLRNIALRRFGYDFDDNASYPRAAFRSIPIHRHLAGILLRNQNREEIMQKLGHIIFPFITSQDSRKLIKHLINLLDMDGTYGGWRHLNQVPAHVRLGNIDDEGPYIKLQDGSTFPCRGYFSQQPSRTKWLANHLPDMLELETYWKQMEGGSTEPARTLKSDILAEWEAISRTAKVHWAEAGGHDWLSLQHDGVVIALRPGLSKEHARFELESTCHK